MRRTLVSIVLAVAALSASAQGAAAYIGPGAGLSAIGTLAALLAALALGIVGFVWYPVKRLRARRKMRPAPDTEAKPS